MTRAALYACIALATASLTGGYIEGNFTRQAIAFGLLGLVWIICEIKRWNWISSPALTLIITASAVGLWLGLRAGWMLVPALYALAAWDLSDFTRRLRLSAPEDDRRLLERNHLARLALVLVTGLFVSVADLGLRIRFTFEWAFALVALSVGGVSMLVWWLRREE
jgi:hypothetical protein